MRILILANNDVGLYQFRRELLHKMIDLDNKVFISLPNGEMIQPLVDAGCEFVETSVDRRGINPITDFGLICDYFKILKRVKPDLVVTYTIKPNIYGCFASRVKKIPYAANITGLGTAFQNAGILRSLVVMMYKFALKNAQVVFFQNIENRRLFLEEFNICSEKQCKLLNGSGVNLEHYRYTEYPIDDTTIHFLFIGRVMKEKGIEELFDAMQRLHKEGKKCILDVVGGFEENYSIKIENYQTAGWLKYYGYQEDVRPFIEKCHCFVLPSWHEGMANTNLESAAMGRPLITSNIPGCREAVIEGESGFLCEAKNSDSLYQAMEKFLSLSHEKRAEMGRVGRSHMEKVFDKELVVAEILRSLRLSE